MSAAPREVLTLMQTANDADMNAGRRAARENTVRTVRTVRGGEHPEHPEHSNGLFVSKPMNQWLREANERPAPTPLCDVLWLQGELMLLFGSTGEGKTAFAMQISNDIAAGRTSTGLTIGSPPCVVKYFDFELSDAQHASRYREHGDTFSFSDNLHRVEMDLARWKHASIMDSNWEQTLLTEIEREVVESHADVAVIDNITWLSRETDKGRMALPLMQGLHALKVRINKIKPFSMMVQAHTPKRDQTRPITLNDLAGSRILANFADAVCAIGKSASDSGVRYLKQCKVRSGEAVYGTAEHVATFNFGKESNFLGFQFTGAESERNHLRELGDGEYNERTRQAKELHAKGYSQRQIAKELGVTLSTANKYVHRADGPNVANNSEHREHPRTPANSHTEEIFFPAGASDAEIDRISQGGLTR